MTNDELHLFYKCIYDRAKFADYNLPIGAGRAAKESSRKLAQDHNEKIFSEFTSFLNLHSFKRSQVAVTLSQNLLI